MDPQWDYPEDPSRPCRFVALLDLLAAMLMRRCFIFIVTQETGFTEKQKGFDSMRSATRQILLSKDSLTAEFVRLRSVKYQGSIWLANDDRAGSLRRRSSHGDQKEAI
jgi:hypothetical protein